MEDPEQETPTGAVIPVPTGHGQPVLGFEGAHVESAERFPSSWYMDRRHSVQFTTAWALGDRRKVKTTKVTASKDRVAMLFQLKRVPLRKRVHNRVHVCACNMFIMSHITTVRRVCQFGRSQKFFMSFNTRECAYPSKPRQLQRERKRWRRRKITRTTCNNCRYSTHSRSYTVFYTCGS